jgi:hypothetical protein
LPKAAPPDQLGFASKPDSLRVGETLGLTAELFEENSILFLEVFDHRLLVLVHPAGDGNQEELELGCHGGRKHSKTLAVQSSRLPQRIFLAVQGRMPANWRAHMALQCISSGKNEPKTTTG